MGMLIHRHRDRHQVDGPKVSEDTEPTPATKAGLQAQAAELGLSTRGNKAELQARIDAHKAETEQPDEQPETPDEGEQGEHDEQPDESDEDQGGDADGDTPEQ